VLREEEKGERREGRRSTKFAFFFSPPLVQCGFFGDKNPRRTLFSVREDIYPSEMQKKGSLPFSFPFAREFRLQKKEEFKKKKREPKSEAERKRFFSEEGSLSCLSPQENYIRCHKRHVL